MRRKQKPSVVAFALTIGTVLFVIIPSIPSLANTPPEPGFSAWRSEEKGETVVSFDASSSQDTDGRITRYQWTFGDGTSGSGVTVEHTYPRIGSYALTLLVFDDGGATQFLTKTIDIAELPASPTAVSEGPIAPASASAPRSSPSPISTIRSSTSPTSSGRPSSLSSGGAPALTASLRPRSWRSSARSSRIKGSS